MKRSHFVFMTGRGRIDWRCPVDRSRRNPAMRAAAVVTALWAVAFVPTAPAAPAPGTALTGTVVAADGTPAAGAAVWAVRPTFGVPHPREPAADARGTFAFDFPPGRWSFGARRGTQGGELQ